MKTSNKIPKKHSDFTLLELMIVIAIMIVLISMMLPALRRARDSVKTIACGGNFRQIGLSQAGYSQDFNDWIVPSFDGSLSWYNFLSGVSSNGSAIGNLGAYGLMYYGRNKTAGSFVCPAEKVAFGSDALTSYCYTHYAVNSRLAGISTFGQENENYYRRKTTVLTSPSIALFAADNIRKNNPHVNYAEFVAYRHGGNDFRDNPTDSSGVNLLDGYANVLYMDGHVNRRNFKALSSSDAGGIYSFNWGFIKSGTAFE